MKEISASGEHRLSIVASDDMVIERVDLFCNKCSVIVKDKNAQHSVHLTAFGASARARIAHWLIILAYRILPIGGR